MDWIGTVLKVDAFIAAFRVVVLWEAHCDNYWHQGNMSKCLIDTMKDTEGHLRSGRLDNYFNTRENILAGKDRAVLNTLADHLKQERMKLTHIQWFVIFFNVFQQIASEL